MSTRVAADSTHNSHQDQPRPSKPGSPREMLATMRKKLQDPENALSYDPLLASLSSDIIGHLGSEDNILLELHHHHRRSFSNKSASVCEGELLGVPTASAVVAASTKPAADAGPINHSRTPSNFPLLTSSDDDDHLSLTQIANAQSSSGAASRRRRRSLITASSPTSSSRRVRRLTLQSQTTSTSATSKGLPSPNSILPRIPIHPNLGQRPLAYNRTTMLNSFRTLSGRIKRLPKRSLKPLDFSNIRKQHQNGWKLAVDGSSGSIDQFGRSLGRSQSESHLMVQSSPSFPFPPSPTHESGDLSNRRRPLEASSRKSLAARSNRNSVSVVEPSQENIVVDQNAHCINNNDSDRLRVTQGGNNAKKPASSSSKSLAGKTNNCKYCGKQYRYRSKLKSHEQHCPSKLEALLYSQGDTPEQQALEDSAPREGDTVSCVCGPRRPYSKNTQNVQPGNNAELDSQEMVRCTHCSCWLHRLCVSLVQLVLPDPYCCPNCTLKLSQARPSQEQTMSPESQRLAKLLADVPDTSETEDEDPVTRAAMIQSKRSLAKPEGDSEGTMSLTDVSELARFHRQGKQSTIGRSRKDYETPDFTRLIRSDADFILSNSHHHQQLQSHQSNQHHPGMFHNLYTDNILSSDADFIHISFPFNIDGAAGQGADTNSSASNAAQSQQLAVQTSNAISLASDPPVQWHIDAIQLLGTEHSTANPAAAGFQVPSQASSADGLQVPVGMDLASLLGGSSGGSGGRNSGNSNGTGAGGASGSAAVTAAASAGISGGLYHDLIASDSAFPDLLNQFSNANCTSTATSMLPPALAFPAFSAMTTNGVPLVPQVAGRRSALHDNSDGFIEHGSSSTITIMHDNFSDLVMTSKAPMSEPGSAVSQRQSFGLPSSSIIMPAAAASRGGSNRTNVVAASDKAHNIPTSMSLASGVPLGTGQHPMTDPTNDIRLEQLLTNVTLPQSFQQELPPGSELLDKELEGLINFDV